MTFVDAMQLIIKRCGDCETMRQAALALNRIQNGSNGETAARRVIAAALLTDSLAPEERQELEQLRQPPTRQKTKTARIDFRCSENEKNCIELLAAKYAGGSISKLILETLEERYPTL